ncbi:hypothetical protein LUX12_20345 [Streptomyces somaliensis]|uniref:hypothetical protein n=1 Tax=Streptomyces somaliensis TaxID=78355 RepID=UPI0020CB6E05|nr:hypothetical protein [Streptomyces somaliensis]MCP9946601.1 hypothetical protein [Streptomyces somaliensis]MCP9960261.1 hypothetical protein [Streptomyces somaliensis]MCP9973027.1 hypothetical protein [Streptomyces somaliensis]
MADGDAVTTGAADDAVMTGIGQATMLLHGGDREEARNRLHALWERIGADGDPLHRCTLAHYLADAQDDPDAELAWDLRALIAAEALGEERLARHGTAAALRALYPSLHLNLAADYLGLHRPDDARAHLDRARAASAALADDGYGAGVRAAIDRLDRRLRAGGA